MRETLFGDTIAIETMFIPLVVGVFLILFVLRLTADKSFILSILENKKRKKVLLSFINDELTNTESALLKLKADIEIVDKFNIMHTKAVELCIKKMTTLYDYLPTLEDTQFEEQIKNFGFEVKRLNEDIVFLEDTIYKAHAAFLEYVKKANVKHESGLISKETYINELNFHRDRVISFIKDSSSQRNVLYNRLLVLVDQKKHLFDQIEAKQKQLNHKRIYIRHMSYV